MDWRRLENIADPYLLIGLLPNLNFSFRRWRLANNIHSWRCLRLRVKIFKSTTLSSFAVRDLRLVQVEEFDRKCLTSTTSTKTQIWLLGDWTSRRYVLEGEMQCGREHQKTQVQRHTFEEKDMNSKNQVHSVALYSFLPSWYSAVAPAIRNVVANTATSANFIFASSSCYDCGVPGVAGKPIATERHIPPFTLLEISKTTKSDHASVVFRANSSLCAELLWNYTKGSREMK